MDESISFGTWLKQRRKALDLTQAELAQRVGCAMMTIQKIEADERRPSKEIAVRLAQALELPPEEHAPFIQAARAERAVDRLRTCPRARAPQFHYPGTRRQLRPPTCPCSAARSLGASRHSSRCATSCCVTTSVWSRSPVPAVRGKRA